MNCILNYSWLTQKRERIHSDILRHHKTLSTDKCKNKLNCNRLTTFALWLPQLHRAYRIVQVIFLHGKLARAINQPGFVNSTFHHTREEASLTAGHQLIWFYIWYPPSPAQALEPYAAVWKKLLPKQENSVAWFGAMRCSERAEPAWDLEAAETGQRCTPHGPIRTAWRGHELIFFHGAALFSKKTWTLLPGGVMTLPGSPSLPRQDLHHGGQIRPP